MKLPKWVPPRSWAAWHHVYDNPQSRFSVRLRLVQAELRRLLDASPPGTPLTVVSICSGQGYDILGVLENHPRAGAVTTVLVDSSAANARAALARAERDGIPNVRTVVGDAGLADTYRDVPRADVVIVVGCWHYLDDDDLPAIGPMLTQICAPGAAVVWSEGCGPENRRPIEDYERALTASGFRTVDRAASPPVNFEVYVAQLVDAPNALEVGRRFFTFRDHRRRTVSVKALVARPLRQLRR
jgi:SAM-dependent methyltransferase